MRKTPILLLTAGLFLSNCKAQSLRYPLAMPYLGLTAYSSKQTDVFSFTANQAALNLVKNTSIGIYGERRFLLEALSNYAAAFAIKSSAGNFGVQMNYAGFKNFNENKVGLAYAKNLGKKVDVGIQFNYFGYRVAGYGNASTINAEAGVLLHLSGQLNAGVHVYNPIAGKLGKTGDEKLASAYKFGLGYDASDNFFAAVEIVKEEDKPVNVIGGFQYQFARQFFVKAGFLSEYTSGFAGVGIGFNKLRLDIAGSYHPQLGFSPGILLIANFGSKTGK